MVAETVSEKLDRIARRGYPTTASIEVTAQCNARCEYCYVKDGSFTELSTGRLCAAIDKLSKSGVFHLHLTGGEPFLRPDILTIFSFAIEHGIFHCTLFSNGILLTEKHLDFLIHVGYGLRAPVLVVELMLKESEEPWRILLEAFLPDL